MISELAKTNEYLFPAARAHIRNKPTTTFNGWSKAKPTFDAVFDDVRPFRIPHLIRTYATCLQRLGVRLEVTEALIGHISGTRSGVVGIYQRYDWMREMREAVAAFENYLAGLSPS